METIFSLATAQGKSGVAVIRISGPDAGSVAARLCGPLPASRFAALRSLRDPDGGLLDQALVLRFDAPGSFTGEDVIELQTHGSSAVYRAVLRVLGSDPRARLAEPGEFTRRALENNRLDLTQVEGLADLIDAETEAQRIQATRVFTGELTGRVEAWRHALVRAASLLEATIDFADEDVPVDVTPEVAALVQQVVAQLEKEISGTHVAERIRSGFEVAIVGPPNAGKSTLLNRLAGREAAITSEIAGTTRDVIEVRMELDGLPVTFLDTAGLRESDDKVERIGIARARGRAQQSDLRVFLASSTDALGLSIQPQDIVVSPKADLPGEHKGGVSGKTGAGVDELLDRITATLGQRVSGNPVATHERHRQVMEKGVINLREALSQLDHGSGRYDIAAEEMRSSIRGLEGLVGRVDAEVLLDEIFASFCLGK